MTIEQARTEAMYLANLRGVNHVVVKVQHKHKVYTELQYPKGYLELVKPVEAKPSIKEKGSEPAEKAKKAKEQV